MTSAWPKREMTALDAWLLELPFEPLDVAADATQPLGDAPLSPFVSLKRAGAAGVVCAGGLGDGAFGSVLKLVDAHGQTAAAKLCAYDGWRAPRSAVDRAANERRRAAAIFGLFKEADVLAELNERGARHVPRFLGFRLLNGLEPAILMERLAKDLRVIERPGFVKLSNRSLVDALDSMVVALAEIHALGWMTADVKADNFCVVPGRRAVKLVDFGMMRRVEWPAVVPFAEFKALGVQRGGAVGTRPYIARATYFRTPMSPVDNIESLFYVALRLAGENFPWLEAGKWQAFDRKCTYWKDVHGFCLPFFHDWFTAIERTPRDSRLAYEQLIDDLRDSLAAFARDIEPDSDPFPQVVYRPGFCSY
ncbi:Protein kinase domain-containing protein [Aphelenchoides fujianensis]|nr:Protein kinase domain-containing protein [Aphelenchoides fujianensis]